MAPSLDEKDYLIYQQILGSQSCLMSAIKAKTAEWLSNDGVHA